MEYLATPTDRKSWLIAPTLVAMAIFGFAVIMGLKGVNITGYGSSASTALQCRSNYVLQGSPLVFSAFGGTGTYTWQASNGRSLGTGSRITISTKTSTSSETKVYLFSGKQKVECTGITNADGPIDPPISACYMSCMVDETGGTVCIKVCPQQAYKITLSQPPYSGTYMSGSLNVGTLGIDVTTLTASDVTINNLTLTGYIADTNPPLSKGVYPPFLSVGGEVNAVRLIDKTTGQQIGSVISNHLSDATGTIEFGNLNFTIPGNSTKTIIVKTDLSPNPPLGDYDIFSFDVENNSDVVATDSVGSPIQGTGAPVNNTTGPLVMITKASGGSLTSSMDYPGTPGKGPLYWGQDNAPFTRFKFVSTGEGFFIERLTLYGDTIQNANDNIRQVTIHYKNKNGDALLANGVLNSGAKVVFSFLPPKPPDTDTRLYVPKDGILYVDVVANIHPAIAFFRPSGVTVAINFDGTSAGGFLAVGENSGRGINEDTQGIDDAIGNPQYIYRAFPKFTYLGTPGTSLSVGNTLIKFKVDAMGLASDGATVLFDGATGPASGSIKFALQASGSATNSVSFQLVKTEDDGTPQGNIVTGVDTANDVLPGVDASLNMKFDITDIDIPAGHSKTFEMQIRNVSGFLNAGFIGRAPDYMQLSLKNNEDSLIYWTDYGGVDRNNSNGSISNILRSLPMNGDVVTYK